MALDGQGCPPLVCTFTHSAVTPLTSPRQSRSPYDSVFQWLHLRLSYPYPLDRLLQRPEANPLVLSIVTSFLQFLTTSLFLSVFSPAYPADEAGSLLENCDGAEVIDLTDSDQEDLPSKCQAAEDGQPAAEGERAHGD